LEERDARGTGFLLLLDFWGVVRRAAGRLAAGVLVVVLRGGMSTK
jgi:hypothetical protein